MKKATRVSDKKTRDDRVCQDYERMREIAKKNIESASREMAVQALMCSYGVGRSVITNALKEGAQRGKEL